MKRPIWIPPLISITILLYYAAALLLFMNYYIRGIWIIRIAFGMMVVGSISLATHIHFKYGGFKDGISNQKISGPKV